MTPDYAPTEVSEDDVNEQEHQFEEIEQNINGE